MPNVARVWVLSPSVSYFASRRFHKYLIEIAANGPEAMRAAKALLRGIANQSIADAAPITAKAIAERRVSEEAQRMMKKKKKK